MLGTASRMSKKLRVRYPKKPIRAAPRRSERVIVKLSGPYDLEVFSLELQKTIARLQDMGAQGVVNCSLYFAPTNSRGEATTLKDEQGKTVEALDIKREFPAG